MSQIVLDLQGCFELSGHFTLSKYTHPHILRDFYTEKYISDLLMLVVSYAGPIYSEILMQKNPVEGDVLISMVALCGEGVLLFFQQVHVTGLFPQGLLSVT